MTGHFIRKLVCGLLVISNHFAYADGCQFDDRELPFDQVVDHSKTISMVIEGGSPAEYLRLKVEVALSPKKNLSTVSYSIDDRVTGVAFGTTSILSPITRARLIKLMESPDFRQPIEPSLPGELRGRVHVAQLGSINELKFAVKESLVSSYSEFSPYFRYGYPLIDVYSNSSSGFACTLHRVLIEEAKYLLSNSNLQSY